MIHTEKRISNPFPGLRSYAMEEDHLYFGMEQQINDLMGRLRKTRFLSVVGSSGSGKSSLIRAGLLPSLFQGFMSDKGTAWRLAVMRPGENPIGNLAAVLASPNVLGNEEIPLEMQSAMIESTLRRSDLGLVEATRQAYLPQHDNLLIVVDQFEEIFRFKDLGGGNHNNDDAITFIKLLLAARETEVQSIYIVLTMRADYLGDCTVFEGLADAINDGQYLVRRMTRAERKVAITGPVAVGGGEISNRLLMRLLNDAGDNPDQLPILQHALMRTWENWVATRSEGEALDIVHYEAIGTMTRALSLHADEAFGELEMPKQKAICEKIFKALTDKGTGTSGIRRPTRLAEICRLTEATEAEVQEVIEIFRKPGRSFLMPPANVRLHPEIMVDISHESLMRVWEQLSSWVQDEIQSADIYLRLSASASLYQAGKAALWRDPELQAALNWKQEIQPNETWASRYDDTFERTMLFLEYSHETEQLEKRRKEEKRKQSLKRARYVAIFMGAASAVSLLLMVFALTLKFKAEASEKTATKEKANAIVQKDIAEKETIVADSAKKVAVKQSEIAIAEKAKAERQRVIAEKNEQYALLQQQIAIQQKNKADQAKLLEQTARNEADANKELAEMKRDEAEKAGENEKIARQKAEVLRLLALSRVIAIRAQKEFKDGNQQVAQLLALQAFRFNQRSGGSPFNSDIFAALALTADHQRVFENGARSATSSKSKVAAAPMEAIRCIAINPRENWLATGSEDGIVRLWDVQNPLSKPVILHGRESAKLGDAMRSLAFSQDGLWLLGGCNSGLTNLWNLNQLDAPPTAFAEHTAVVTTIVVDQKLDLIITISLDSTMRYYQWSKPTAPPTIHKLQSRLNAAAFDANAGILAIGAEDGSVNLYDPKHLDAAPVVLHPFSKGIRSIAISPDGTYLAAASSDGMIKLINRNHPTQAAQRLVGHNAGVNALKFEPNGRLLASASADKTIRLWNYKHPETESIKIVGHDAWVWTLAFAPDGNTLFSGSADRKVLTWTTDAAVLADKVCTLARRNLTQDEWDKFIGSQDPLERNCEGI
jgi:WD40 repeat protein/energy-coupling factor transporter ATP-binding protein EcfA2